MAVFWLIFASTVCIVSSRLTKEKLDDNVDRYQTNVNQHGILPTFLRSQAASVCHTLVGDLCPRVKDREYDDNDSADRPIMGNTDKYDIKIKRVPGASHAEVRMVRPMKSYPAPGEKPYHVDVTRRPEN